MRGRSDLARDTRRVSASGESPRHRRVTVVGTLNLDLVLRVSRRPAVGETVLGRSLVQRPGGKGANQALAAAAEASTSLIGATGTDAAGDLMIEALEKGGVDVTHVRRVAGTSGHAVIEVDDDGDNSIVVITGANAELGAHDVVSALDATRPDVVVTQLESPMEAIAAAAGWADDRGRRFVLNPSPAEPVDPRILAAADPLIVNQLEAAYYADAPASADVTDADITDMARQLLSRSRSVIITRGGEPTIVATAAGIDTIAVPRIRVVDTTGAGDVFAGTLAARLARGAGLLAAAGAAVTAASAHVGRERTVGGGDHVDGRSRRLH